MARNYKLQKSLIQGAINKTIGIEVFRDLNTLITIHIPQTVSRHSSALKKKVRGRSLAIPQCL